MERSLKPRSGAGSVFEAAGALLAGAAIGLSAYAAHADVGAAQPPLQMAAIFAFGHGLALNLLSREMRGRLDQVSALVLLFGAVLFSGALVSKHVFAGPSFFAPWGGVLLMLGWLLRAAAAFRR